MNVINATRAQLEAAREALLPLVHTPRWERGEAPPLYVHAVEALRRIEDALGLPHTIPTRAERRRREAA